MTDQKQKRLRALASIAGALSVKAYLGGNRDRAIHFQKRMKRILWPIWDCAQGENNG